MRAAHAFCLSLALLSSFPTAPQAQGMSLESFVLLEKDALLVMPPRQVAAGAIKKAEWSPDGRYVLALRSELPYGIDLFNLKAPPQASVSLVLWNASSGKSKELWSGETLMEARGSFEWLSKGDIALAVLDINRPSTLAERRAGAQPTREERWLCRVDARLGLLKSISRVDQFCQIIAAPGVPAAFLYQHGESGMQVVRADGLARPLVFPDRAVLLGVSQWMEDGRHAVVGLTPAPRGEKGAKQQWILADVLTGEVSLTTAPKQQSQGPSSPSGDFRIRLTKNAVREATATSPISPLWLESTTPTEKPSALLAANALWAKLSPAGDAVLYGDERGAWAVKPSRVPKPVYVEARNSALRAVALSNAKQAGTGLHMWAVDNNDRLPEPSDNLVDMLSAYTKTRVIFEGFSYTYGGGPLSEIAEPSKLIVGHVAGPGGRAMIYADGHVKWQADGE